jgi:hypothetical protein
MCQKFGTLLCLLFISINDLLKEKNFLLQNNSFAQWTTTTYQFACQTNQSGHPGCWAMLFV